MTNARTSRALWGIGTDFAGTAVLAVVSFAATPIMLRHLSGSGYGFWVTALQVMSLLGLLDFSLGLGVVKFGADPKLQNSEEYGELVSTAFFSYCVMGAIILIAGSAAAPFIPRWFSVPPEEAAAVTGAFRLSALSTAVTLPLSTFVMILRSVQKLGLANVLGIATSLLSTLISLVLLTAGGGLMALPLGTLMGVVLMGLAAAIAAHRVGPPFQIRIRYVTRRDAKKLWWYSATLQLGRVANTIASSCDGVVVSLVLGAAAVTPYSLTTRLPNLLGAGLSSKIPGQLMPAIAELYAVGDWARLKKTYLCLLAFMVRFGAIAASIVAAGDQAFLKTWVGPGHFGGGLLLFLASVLTFADSAVRGTAVFLWLSPAVGSFAMISSIEAALNVGLSFYFARHLGLAGVVLGTVISRALVTGPYVAYKICRLLSVRPSEFFVTGILMPVAKSGTTFLTAILLARFVPTELGSTYLWIIGAGCVLVNIATFDVPRLWRRARPNTSTDWVRLIMALD